MSIKNEHAAFEKPFFAVLQKVLPELVRLTYPSGIGYEQMNECLKKAYVDVITDIEGHTDRKTNIATTAALTGISKEEAKHLRDNWGTEAIKRLNEADHRRLALSNLLVAWDSYAPWVDEDGKARVLPMVDGPVSFAALVKEQFGELPMVAALRELKLSGAVQVEENGDVRLVESFFGVPSGTAQQAERMGSLLADYIKTLRHNFFREEGTPSLVEYRSMELNIPTSHLEEYYALLRHQARELCDTVSDWLEEKKVPEPIRGETYTRLGVGIFQIKGD